MEWLWLVLLFVVVFFIFARFTIVEEGTAKVVKRLGEFSYVIFRWKGHWMDTEGTIFRDGETSKFPYVEQSTLLPLRIFGGLYLYGFWPMHEIHKYPHRWTDIHLGEDGEVELKFHEDDFSHVLLKPAVYAIKLVDLETKPPERIPLTVLILVTLKVNNPYRFLFVAPPTPIEDVLARMGAALRPLLTGKTWDELLLLRGESLWAERDNQALLKGMKLIEETLEKWGMAVADKGIEIRDIAAPPEYQKAGAVKRQLQLQAQARAEEIRGTLISAVARSEGREEKEVQEEFRKDPKAFYEKHQRTVDDVMTKLSMEARAYLKAEFPQGTTLEGLIALWQRMPLGEDSRGEQQKKKTWIPPTGDQVRAERERMVREDKEAHQK
jgi:regulator of protease activity HflC (stomatin/prohibitin superfamily)